MMNDGRAIRTAAERLQAIGAFAAADEYRAVASTLDEHWSADVVCGVNLAVGFVGELISGTTDPSDREAALDEAVDHLLDEAEARGGYTEDELYELAMQRAQAYDEFIRELGGEPDDKPFPEPR